jgi:glycosyltransferase involved in cell wall biosynthesis
MKMRPTKLLLYAHDWIPTVGGVQIVSKVLADGLSEYSKTRPAEAVEVTLLTHTASRGTDDTRFPYKVIREPGLREWIRQIRGADVVQLEGPALLPLVLCTVLGKPLVLRHHGYQSICPNGILIFSLDSSVCPGYFMERRYRKCLSCNISKMGRSKGLRSLLLTFPRRWLSRRAWVNVGVSPHIAGRLALPRTVVIWNGVPTSPVRPVRSDPAGSGTVCFAYVGRLIVEKGVAVLIRACRELSDQGIDYRLKIVGDGPERESLEALAKEFALDLQIEFTGSVDSSAIRKTIESATAVIMPSICEDVAPLAAMEQMMEGRLLIVSDIGGLGQLVGEAGAKFPAGNIGALARCMRDVVANPATATERGMEGRKRALAMFSQEQMVNRHVRIYRRLTRVRSKQRWL